MRLEEIVAKPGSADADIEQLLRDIRSGGEWDDRHDDILDRWRRRQGDAGMSDWGWWWKLPDEDLYRGDCRTREKAIAQACSEEPGEPVILLIEARCWADDIADGDDTDWFADTRNPERLEVV